MPRGAHAEDGLRAIKTTPWLGAQPDLLSARARRPLGFTSLEDFLVRSWEANYLRRDMRNLLAQL